jgi:hypothetical protein
MKKAPGPGLYETKLNPLVKSFDFNHFKNHEEKPNRDVNLEYYQRLNFVVPSSLIDKPKINFALQLSRDDVGVFKDVAKT